MVVFALSVDHPSDHIVWKAVVMKASFSNIIEVRVSSDVMDMYVNGRLQETKENMTYRLKGFHRNVTLKFWFYCYLNMSSLSPHHVFVMVIGFGGDQHHSD